MFRQRQAAQARDKRLAWPEALCPRPEPAAPGRDA